MTTELRKRLESICFNNFIDGIDTLREIVEDTLEAIIEDTEENEPYATKSIERLKEVRSTISTELDTE